MSDSLLSEVDRLGRRVLDGDLMEADAAHRLVQFSDGGLTRVGAADLMTRWVEKRTGRFRKEGRKL